MPRLRTELLQRLPTWTLGLGVGLLSSLALVTVRERGALEPLEFGLYDREMRAARAEGGAGEVALIEIREEDLRIHGHPLSDAILARAIGSILRQGPVAVGVDLFRDQPLPPGSDALRRVVVSDPRVVMVEKFGEEGSFAVPAPEYVRGSSQVGFADLPRDDDGKVRRGLLAMQGEGGAGFSLALRLALRSLGAEGAKVPLAWRGSTLLLDGHPVPRFESEDGGYAGADAGGYQVPIDFRTAFGREDRQTLDDLLRGRVPPGALRDRIVLLGMSAESVKDEHATPVGTLSGVELHALLAAQLLHMAQGGASLRTASPTVESAFVVGLGLLAALSAVRIRSPLLLLVLGAGVLAFIAVAARVSFEKSVWLPAAPLGLSWAVAGGGAVAVLRFRERAERGRVMDLLERVLSREVAEEIWRRRDEFLHEGRLRARRATVTVLASDLEGYTSAVEILEPEVLMEWANGYLEALAGVVARYRGLVDDYAGDGIKADFGVPIPSEAESEIVADAEAAVACAIEMGREVARLNAVSRERHLPTVRLRIGIVTGPVVIGMIGSAHRLKYTTVGDTVNTAARLEGFEKEAFAREPKDRVLRILVSESTRARLGPQHKCEEVGEMLLKGKSEAVRVHRIWPPQAVEGT